MVWVKKRRDSSGNQRSEDIVRLDGDKNRQYEEYYFFARLFGDMDNEERRQYLVRTDRGRADIDPFYVMSERGIETLSTKQPMMPKSIAELRELENKSKLCAQCWSEKSTN